MDIDKAKEIIETMDNNTESNNDNNTGNVSNNDNKPKTSREISNEVGKKNLVPFGSSKDNRSEEEVKSINRLGGIKSGETRRKRKTAQELLAKILSTNLTNEQIEEILGNADSLLNGDKSAYNVMLVKMTQQAMAGDTKAFIALRDTAGDKPQDSLSITTDTMTDEDRKEINAMRKQLMDISKIG